MRMPPNYNNFFLSLSLSLSTADVVCILPDKQDVEGVSVGRDEQQAEFAATTPIGGGPEDQQNDVGESSLDR